MKLFQVFCLSINLQNIVKYLLFCVHIAIGLQQLIVILHFHVFLFPFYSVVQDIFKELLEAGYLDIEKVDQLLCTKCNRYLADRFVEGTCPLPDCGYEDARGDQCDGCGKLVNAVELIRPRCKLCGNAPILRESKHFFFNLTKISDKLHTYLDSVTANWTNNARVITNAWLKEGLKPRCITRDLKWGIPVPHKGFEDKVFYVWFDAVLGYISISSRYTKEWKQWWQPENKDVKVMY